MQPTKNATERDDGSRYNLIAGIVALAIVAPALVYALVSLNGVPIA